MPSGISRSGWIILNMAAAPLLGVKACCIICQADRTQRHLKMPSGSRAEFSTGKVNEKIERELAAASLGNPQGN